MVKLDDIFKGAFAAAMTIATYLFGHFDGMIIALIAVISLDYVTGFLAAAYKGQLSSAAGAKGIIKKIMYMAMVALANIIDGIVGMDSLLRDASIYFFIANEGLSILENAAGMGFPFPQFLKDRLEQFKGTDRE